MTESFFDRINKNKTLHTPDVLSCLANLSNDEVFTPPEMVNQMLDMLPQELFESPDTTFLDPACKTGVFLREIAKRLLVGLEKKIPDLQERIDHIFHKQLYGIAITELTALLSRRSVYCSKYPNGRYSVSHFENSEGNIRFKKIQHTWIKGRCQYCGASQSEYDRAKELETHAYEFIHKKDAKEILNMKFDVIISNPPYQLSDGGGTGSSAIPLYHKFVEQAKKLSPRYIVMITPSRWFAGGKGLDSFRENMLNDNHLVKLIDYADSAECFPGVTIAGGVSYFLWNKDYNGICSVSNIKGGEIASTVDRALNEYSIFVRDNIAIDIIRKTKNINKQTLADIVYSRNCFDLISGEKGHPIKKDSDIRMLSLNGFSYIEKSKITDKDKLLGKYKVIMTKAMSGGNKPSSDGKYLVVSTIKVLEPNEVCTETYLVLHSFDSKELALNFENYVKTKFFRFMLLQALTSINISKEKFCFVPEENYAQPITDDLLYKKYNLTEKEIDFIESLIKPMDGGDE
ncbi:MAG: Eco57I restriction-modification methylase domain-containing protein [Clostridia bacterium]|nr:Eco57I restriction-modification methylase domain-containing protein [Clostridia bacterium]